MTHKYLKNVASLRLDAGLCTGCGKCIEVCPHAVLDVHGKKAVIANLDRCIECGACAINCPASALGVDSGVGCAQAVIVGWLTGTEPSCDCSSGHDCC